MISSRPLVSVVIPTRNRPILVLRAGRSALHQTLREIEVIVVIDGEPGRETAGAIARLGRGPGALHRVARGGGGGSEARNIGIRDALHVLRGLLCSMMMTTNGCPQKLRATVGSGPSSSGGTAKTRGRHASTYFAPKAKSM